MEVLYKLIDSTKIWGNTGQIKGLPKNPRFIRDERFEALVKSIKDDPEMLELRECVVYPYAGEYVVIMGNMRVKACIELGIKKVPCKILTADTPIEKLKAFTIKDNVSFGQDSFDDLANEWDADELRDWGMILSDFEPEEDPEPEAEKSSTVRLVIEFESLDNYDTVKAEVREILRSYEGATLKE